MQTYTQMRDSGVAWLGDIPAEWQQKHAKYLFEQVKESVGSDPSQYELLSLTLRGIIPRSQVDGGKNPDNYSAYQVVNKNDLIMCLFDYDVTPRTVGRATRTGMVTGAYTNLRPLHGVSTRYYNYFFLALDTTKELLHLCTGLRNGLSKPTFFELNLPVPDYETQERIANYLDEETALIDDLIAKQQRLLVLLEEKRRATITHAVTRGLNPIVELKETNIPWFGQIPAHWKLQPIKAFAQINNGSDYKNIQADDSEGYPVIGSGGQFTSATKFVYDGKSVLFGRKGTIDKPLYFEGKFWTVDTMFWSKIDEERIIPKYLYYAALSIPYEYYQTKTALPSMTQSNLLNHQLAIPDMKEQEQIISKLERKQREFDKLNQIIRTQVSLLKERRTSLISHAVTGKIKV